MSGAPAIKNFLHASQDMRRRRKSISRRWSSERFAEKWALFLTEEFDANVDAAEFFGVEPKTITNWIKQRATPSGNAVGKAAELGFLDGDYRV